jgi:hypothetical protein
MLNSVQNFPDFYGVAPPATIAVWRITSVKHLFYIEQTSNAWRIEKSNG